MKIFGWLADHAGCGWYRIALPFGELRKHGVETTWASRMHSDHWESDIIVAQRTCLPGPTKGYQRIAKHRGKRPVLVFELDDDLWSIDRSNRISSGFYSEPEIRANLVENIRMADAVTVSTEPLAAIVRRWNSNVTVLPNTVPAEILQWQPGHYRDRTTIGWQGSPTHDGDWFMPSVHIKTAFERLSVGRSLEMHTVGDIPKHFPEVHPHRHSPWQEDVHAYYRLLDWHVALAPLADTPFNRAKSDIRVLEAAALGFPVVASAVAAYEDSVQHGQTGFLVRTHGEWFKYLSQLINDPHLRAHMSSSARQWAAKRAVDVVAEKWLAVYNALV